ncbi:baseplate J/gp47 family protein [Halapricum desulfuricans]|uniref:Putative phage protein gp47/JayE n=1 Tax=Halapricum desulfuricans TaxID=2841257 RepID=A0A897N0F2_9EURY|nr:baseplate J/gp47 family protein [Halapricum desulfuricans]QSG06412.1 putative phage protein gp47/JayE [Halapricum desulfuricans]
MTIGTDGQFEPDSVEFIVQMMMDDAKLQLGSDLNDDEKAVIRFFYQPVAERLHETYEDIGSVLASSQIKYAEGAALDLLVERIGLSRYPAEKATGTVTFSRGTAATTDYTIPAGTVVQTATEDPVKFQTTEVVSILSGTTEIDATIEAIDGGIRGNVGANTITDFENKPAGVDEVNNAVATSGGSDEEPDNELRERALRELSESKSATPGAILDSVRAMDKVSSATIFVNNTGTDNSGSGGLSDHAFEVVVDGTATDEEIAQTILEKMPAGATPFGGAHGTLATAPGTLSNGQSIDVSFSWANPVQIYVDAEFEVTGDYAGDEDVENAIVSYIGGTLNSGNIATGRVNLFDEVLYGEIEYAIRSVTGVYDVTSLQIKKGSSGTWTTGNIQMNDDETPTADATDGSLSITSSVINQ